MTLRLVPDVHRLAPHLGVGEPLGGAQRTPGETLPPGRDDLVTRPVCLTGETFEAKSPDFRTFKPLPVCSPEEARSIAAPFFVDWISVSQDHPEGGLPVVDAGCVIAIDADGEMEWKTAKAVKHEGSFETSLNVRSDGYRVSFTGNVSRFGRPDNVFGFGFWQCIDRVNAVLAGYGLPPLTAGQRMERVKHGQVSYVWSGARVSRIDLTANFEAGSADDAHAVMQYLGSQHAGRHEGRVLGQGETVAWGTGSRRQYWKAYIKHLELKRRGCEDTRLVEHCAMRGVVRFEGTLRSNALTDLGCAYLGDYERGWAMPQLIQLFKDHTEVLSRAKQSTDDIGRLPKHLRGTARDYLAGMDMTSSLARATFYRHRRELLSFGIDIAVRNVRPFQPRVRVIELRPAEVPSWYQLVA